MDNESRKKPTKRPVPAVTRALAIMRFLARSPDPVGVNPIARNLDLVPSTCLHILRVLQDEGIVDFDSDTKKYSMGIGILPLAKSAMQRNTFSTLVQPRLEKLSKSFDVTSIATQLLEPGQMVVIALSQSSLPYRLQVDLGSRFPPLISATGRLFAAYNGLSDELLKTEFDKLIWDHPPEFMSWRAEVDQARLQGYALDQGAYISGVTVIAVPVLDASEKMTRSLVSIGISERLKNKVIPKLAKEMMRLRDEIETI